VEHHRRIGAWIASLLIAAAPMALGQTQDELRAQREAKLSSEWIHKADWITDYDQARAASRESGKPIFAYFSRSYAP
jgi:hypothetical protein